MDGIVVGCDQYQEWLLPWWWKHYCSFSSYPVAFADFGMSKEAISWCEKKGIYIPLPEIAYRHMTQSGSLKDRYGNICDTMRSAWLKKPIALKHSPFERSLWLDLDCELRGDITPLFHLLSLGCDIALAQDEQDVDGSAQGEIQYNSGVIATVQASPIIDHWIDAIKKYDLAGDQEYLSRAIYDNKTPVTLLPQTYNWFFRLGECKEAVIFHYSSGRGKNAILHSLPERTGMEVPKIWPEKQPLL